MRYTNLVAKVTVLPANETFEFDLESLSYHDHGKPKSFLDVGINVGFHIEHACGGNCACTTCHVVVKNGAEFLSDMDDDEADKLDLAADLQLGSRLGCQVHFVRDGEVTIEIPSWNRNYVSEGGASMNLGDAIPAPKK